MNEYLRESSFLGISHEESEICLNCWYFTDDTGFVFRLAAKAYALTGTDEQKLNMLQLLSASDHLTAIHDKVPDRFVLNLDGQELRGVVPAIVMQENAIPYFDDLIGKVEKALPENIRAIADQPEKFRPSLIEPILWVSTCVYEAEDGSLIAKVSS